MKMKILISVIIFMAIANMVMTYSCFEIQEKEYRQVAQAVEDAIAMIDDNIHFEHPEE